MDLGLHLRLGTGLSSFSPISLFSAGEQGAWYDPSDFSTMYQDSAGTTPVTAAGQQVGLLLDKSQGLVLGPELVTNGDFSSGTTGWTAGAPTGGVTTLVVASGELSVSNSTANSGYAIQGVSTTVGKWYRATCVARVGVGNGASLRATNDSNGTGTGQLAISTTTSTSNTTLTVTFLASQATTYLVMIAGPTTAPTSYFDNVSVKLLPGNHATQATSAQRPILQQDAGGKWFLLFDGTDDGMVTNTITPGIDKAQVFAGVRKLSDADLGTIAELSASINANNGAFLLRNSNPAGTNGANYVLYNKGTALSTAGLTSNAFPAPVSNVLTGIGDIAADVATLRVNGIQAATSATDQGTGNYLAYPLYIGRRGGTTLPFNGRIYSLIVRFGANLDAAQITQAETWVNGKTGAY